MPDNQKIGLEAVFEDENFQKGIAEYDSAISKSSAATDEGASSMGSAWAGLASVGAVAWAGIAVGVAAVTAELYLAIDAAMQTEDIMAAMEFQVAKTGDKTGITADQINNLAASISKVVPIDDEVITQAITMGMRFDGVTKDNIEPMIRAAADLATSTGKTLPAAMKELALAVSDPDKAMRLLRDANVTLTDEEMKTLKGFKDTGDAAGATAFLIGRVEEKIGGLAETMGQTASGKMKIMQTALGNLQETAGGGLLDALKGVFDKITEFANDPRTIAFITELSTKIGTLASSVVDSLPDIFAVIEGVVSWLQNNQPVIIGILAAIGVAMAAFGVTSAISLAPIIAGLLPVIGILAAVGAAAAVLTKAWQEDWGGMQGKFAKAWDKIKPVFDKLQKWLGDSLPKAIDTLSDYWENVLLPAIKTVIAWVVDNVLPLLADLVVWLGENVPKAIKILGDYWENVLLPAIKAVVDWINQNLIPLFNALVDWLSKNIPVAIQTLSDFWNNVLLPAIRAVYDFVNTYLIPIFNAIVTVISGALTAAINTLATLWSGTLLPAITAVYNFLNDYVFPLFNAISNLIGAVLGAAVRTLAGVWNDVLLPALTAVWEFIDENIVPIFTAIGDVITKTVQPAIESFAKWLSDTALKLFKPFSDWLAGTFQAAWDGIKATIQWLIDNINTLIGLLNGLNLPGGTSGPSFAPIQIQRQVDLMMASRDVASATGQAFPGNSISNSSQRTNNYIYGANFSVSGQTGMIEALQGLS